MAFDKRVGTSSFPYTVITKMEDDKKYSGMIYRTYSEIDLLDLLDIKIALERKEDINYIDLDTILSTYEGHTIFSIFQHYYEVYEKIAKQLKEQEFEYEINANKEIIENKALRRLYRILNMPTIDLKISTSHVFNTQKAGI